MKLLSRASAWTVVALFGLAGPAWAQPASEPCFELRTRKVSDVLATVKKAVLDVFQGEGEAQQQARGAFEVGWNAAIGERGKQLLGVDVDRPVAGYVLVSAEVAGLFVAIPVSDEVLFRQWLENMGLKFQQQGEWFEVTLPDGSAAQARFADKYAHFAFGARKEALPAGGPSAAATAKVLAKPAQALLGGELMPGKVPAQFRDLLLRNMEETVARGQQRKPDETLPRYMGRKWGEKWTADLAKSLINDLQSIDVSLDVTPANRLALAVACRPKEGTTPAKLASASSRSQFGSVVLPGKTLGEVCFHGPLCETLKDGLGHLAEIVFVGAATKGVENAEPDPAVMGLYKLLASHLGPAPLDVRLDGSATETKVTPTYCLRIGVTKGAALETELAAQLPKAPAQFREALELDVAKVGTQRIHALKMPADLAGAYPPGALQRAVQQKMFFAITPDAVMAVMGGEGQATLERALRATAPAGAAPTPQIRYELQLGPLLTFLAANDESLEELPRKFAAVRQAFAGKDDRVLLVAGEPAAQGTAEPGLTVRFELSLAGAAMFGQFISLQLEEVFSRVSKDLNKQ